MLGLSTKSINKKLFKVLGHYSLHKKGWGCFDLIPLLFTFWSVGLGAVKVSCDQSSGAKIKGHINLIKYIYENVQIYEQNIDYLVPNKQKQKKAKHQPNKS